MKAMGKAILRTLGVHWYVTHREYAEAAGVRGTRYVRLQRCAISCRWRAQHRFDGDDGFWRVMR